MKRILWMGWCWSHNKLMYLVPPNIHLKMVKMVNFVLYVLYDNF